jgi:hypothetical protein
VSQALKMQEELLVEEVPLRRRDGARFHVTDQDGRFRHGTNTREACESYKAGYADGRRAQELEDEALLARARSLLGMNGGGR